jgi:hypothetical protein
VSRLSSRVLYDLALLALLAAAMLVVAVSLQQLRPFVVLLAACLVPGGAILTVLGRREALFDLALAIGLSLAVEILGSAVLAWLGWWHPEVLAGVLGGASVVLLVGDLLRAWTHHV